MNEQIPFLNTEKAKKHWIKRTKKTVIEFVCRVLKNKKNFGCIRFTFGDCRYAKGNIYGEIRSDFLSKKIKFIEVFQSYSRKDYLVIIEEIN